MKKEYDLSKTKSRGNPYAKELLKQERSLILEGIARDEVATAKGQTLSQLHIKKKHARRLKK
jgi:hypothetical protein